MTDKREPNKRREQRQRRRRTDDDRREAIRIDEEANTGDRREKAGRRKTDGDPWPK